MNAIRIRKTIDSEVLHLPELRPLIGRTVEIIVLDDTPRSTILPGTGNWDEAMKAVEDLQSYDFDAVRRQRELDLKHARDHMP